jgi:hypothetical protein
MTNFDWDRANVEGRMKRQGTESAFEPSPARTVAKASKSGVNLQTATAKPKKKKAKKNRIKSWDADKELKREATKKRSALLSTIRYLTNKIKKREKDIKIFQQQIADAEKELKKEKYRAI